MHTYTIREISELFSLPASTLRYYESEGLLPFVEKNSSGQRIYTKEHIDRLQCINCFKRTGMTITISEYDFMGGMRAVIRGRNILIDHSFQAAVDHEYHQFSFAAGGAGIE